MGSNPASPGRGAEGAGEDPPPASTLGHHLPGARLGQWGPSAHPFTQSTHSHPLLQGALPGARCHGLGGGKG